MDRDESYLIDGWLEDAYESRVSGDEDEAVISEALIERSTQWTRSHSTKTRSLPPARKGMCHTCPANQ